MNIKGKIPDVKIKNEIEQEIIEYEKKHLI